MQHENATPSGHAAPPTAAEMAMGTTGLSAPAPVSAAPAAPAVRWLTDKKLVESYALEYPFALDGLEVRVVTARRLTAKAVELFMASMRGDESGRALRFPMFFVGDVALPDAAWDVMMDDDRFALGEIAGDFLPARFRVPTDAPRS